jgi:hypothetical protein
MSDTAKQGYWVRFTDTGLAAWFGPAWVEGAEFVEGVDAETLITHRKVDGAWLPREPEPPNQPTPEEIAAEKAEAARQAELARDEALRQALAEEADPMFFKWQRDECDREDWLAKVAEVKARFPKLVD